MGTNEYFTKLTTPTQLFGSNKIFVVAFSDEVFVHKLEFISIFKLRKSIFIINSDKQPANLFRFSLPTIVHNVFSIIFCLSTNKNLYSFILTPHEKLFSFPQSRPRFIFLKWTSISSTY